MPSEPLLSQEDAESLMSLCCQGKLYEVQEWISSRKSLNVPSEFKTNPLEVAIDRGFHSLVLLLARSSISQQAKNKALALAVSKRNLELVGLLLDNDAELAAVPFGEVLLTWEPKLIRFFLDHGADFITGSPFAEAFGARIRTALRPFIECKQKHPGLEEKLQEQADRALRYFSREGNLKWVSLMMWAGASPRTEGPSLGEEDDPDNYTTALKQASYSGNVEILKRLKPQADLDNLSDLLHCAAALGRDDAVSYLLELGASLNDKENGGSSALDACLWRLNFEHISFYDRRRQKTLYDVRRTMDLIQKLVERGALWRPNNNRAISDIRRTLSRCGPRVTAALLRILEKNGSCTEHDVREVLRTPRMKRHLALPQQNQPSHLPSNRNIRYRNDEIKSGFGPKHKSVESVIQPLAPSYWLMQRYNREKLYDEVWAEPIQKLAKKYGISDVGLSKVCRKLGVPLPGLGYWAKKAAGKSVRKRPALPPLAIRG